MSECRANRVSGVTTRRNRELGVSLADGVAEVALVDAVELVCGGEVHGLHDFIGCCTAF